MLAVIVGLFIILLAAVIFFVFRKRKVKVVETPVETPAETPVKEKKPTLIQTEKDILRSNATREVADLENKKSKRDQLQRKQEAEAALKLREEAIRRASEKAARKAREEAARKAREAEAKRIAEAKTRAEAERRRE